MSNPNMESIVKELLELKRMKEELEAEITSMEDEINSVMGDEERAISWAEIAKEHMDRFSDFATDAAFWCGSFS